MISTQVQDVARGTAVARMPVELDVFVTGQGWLEVGHGLTNLEGRITEFGEPVAKGIYRLVYDVGSYLPEGFFPQISTVFEIRDEEDEYHLQLVLTPYGYTTYRTRLGE